MVVTVGGQPNSVDDQLNVPVVFKSIYFHVSRLLCIYTQAHTEGDCTHTHGHPHSLTQLN